MNKCITVGSWVEISRVVLPAGKRAPQVPEDTQRVSLQMRVRGFLKRPAALGEDVEIETLAGRRVTGTLIDAKPAYTHSFGPPVAGLLLMIDEVRG